MSALEDDVEIDTATLEPLATQAAGHPHSIFRAPTAGRVLKPVARAEAAFYAGVGEHWQRFLPEYDSLPGLCCSSLNTTNSLFG